MKCREFPKYTVFYWRTNERKLASRVFKFNAATRLIEYYSFDVLLLNVARIFWKTLKTSCSSSLKAFPMSAE